MPKDIQIGSVTQALQRAFGFKGRYTPMLDEVVVPVYVISDPSPAAVTRISAATRSVVKDDIINFSFLQLFNPAGSGILCNVTSATASSDIKQQLTVAFFDTRGSDQQSNIFFRDRRNEGLPACITLRETSFGTVAFGDAVAVLSVDGALSQTASWEEQTADPRQPLAVLPPGSGVIVRNTIADDAASALSTIIVNWRFLEIPITEQGPAGGISP